MTVMQCIMVQLIVNPKCIFLGTTFTATGWSPLNMSKSYHSEVGLWRCAWTDLRNGTR